MWEFVWAMYCTIVASVCTCQVIYQTVELIRILRKLKEKKCSLTHDTHAA